MRRARALALLASAAIAALALYWLAPSRAAPDGATRTEARAAAAAPAAELEGARELRSNEAVGSETIPARSEVALLPAPALAPPASDAEPRCAVHGQVVDEHGAPLPGARALLYAPKTWREGVDAPRVRPPHLAERFAMVGFEATTDAEGRFELDVPAPANPLASLALVAGPLRDSHTVRFGRGNAGPLVAGERDLGTITLAASGAVKGRVVDGAGRPLAGVELDLGPSAWTTLQRNTWSGDDGRFVLGHAPRGEQHLKAKLDGYLSLAPLPVAIEAGREMDVGDVVLAPAPTIEGTVRDDAGRPLAGAKISAYPDGGGSIASATSGADGRFVVQLPQAMSHTLTAELDGHAPPDAARAASLLVESGARDIELVLAPLPTTRFLVVDAATGQAIERFGFELRPDHGSQARRRWLGGGRRPSPEERPGGVVEQPAREGIDAYTVAADGYLLAERDVQHDAPGVPVQTIRLERGQVVRGRVTDGGSAVASANVSLERWFHVVMEGAPPPRVGDSSAPPTATGADGGFSFSAVAAGQHRLTVRPAIGAPLVRIVEIERGQDLDLGELALLPGATIAGEVLVPSGLDRSGISVQLGAHQDGVRATTDAKGRFRFENVAAGEHDLTSGALSGKLEQGATARTVVAAGETATVTLDARDLALCEVVLLVLVNGEPAAGADVTVTWPNPGRGFPALGRTDGEGRVRGHARGGVEARVSIWHEGASIEHPTARLALEPLGHVEQTVRFEVGGVVVQLPDGATLPAAGRGALELDSRDGEREPQHRSCALDGSRELRFPGVWPGNYALKLELIDAEARPVREPHADGSQRLRWPATWTGRGEATVTLGRTTTVTLE